jgi:hypothetical protein
MLIFGRAISAAGLSFSRSARSAYLKKERVAASVPGAVDQQKLVAWAKSSSERTIPRFIWV